MMRISVVSVVGLYAILVGFVGSTDCGFFDGLRKCLLAAVGGI